jgi:hypothetical protein
VSMTLQQEKELFQELMTQTTNENVLNDVSRFIGMIDEEILGGDRGQRPSAESFRDALTFMGVI